MGSIRKVLVLFALCITGLASALAATTADGLVADRYVLTIDGHTIATFSELAGISSAVAPTAGSTFPGARTPPTVTLKRGMTRNIEMAAWHELVILGDVAAARKSCSLIAYNARGEAVARYHLTDAWPSKVEVGALKAGSSDVLMETITLTAEFIQRVAI